jgi:hypothetical protein
MSAVRCAYARRQYFVHWAREGKLSKAALDPQIGRDLWTYMEEQVAPFEL